jgi:hypothetical protein
VTEGEYGAMLLHVYEFCCSVAAGSDKKRRKKVDPIFYLETPLLKHRSDAMCDFSN